MAITRESTVESLFEEAAASLGIGPETLVDRFKLGLPTLLALLRQSRAVVNPADHFHSMYLAGEINAVLLLLNLLSIDAVPTRPGRT
jgi:hypothetical protein